MKTTHTPGPWNIGLKHPGRVLRFMQDDGSPGAFIACCTNHPDDDDTPTEVEAANARLIAAAPELLSAIERILFSDSPHHETYWEVPTNIISAARMAYDKATRP